MTAQIEPRSLGPRRIDQQLSREQAAEFDQFVVPVYLAPFTQLALEHLEHRPSFTRARTVDLAEPAKAVRVVHLYPRTNFFDPALVRALPGAQLFGADPSPLPSAFADGSFSHGVTIHPGGNVGDRARLLAEYRRVLEPGGQLVLAIPLRGSFTELGDLLREYALKHDAPDVEAAVTGAASLRPGPDGLAQELSRAGFEQISVTTKSICLTFDSGAALFDDPAMRLLVFPELEQNLGISLTKPFHYAQGAIDKYWSGGEPFELTIVAGCAAGYRRA
ncbi:MAG TPA: hypothetical protein VNO21_09130 [Polyangiaceae bacterium]|nr:hypothetical protein [Polyangiaceae bacterium]